MANDTGGWDISRQTRLNLWYLLAAILGVMALQYLYVQSQQVEQIPFSEFRTQLEEGNVASVEVGSETVTGTYEEDVEGSSEFVTRRVDDGLAEILERSGVEYDGTVEDTLASQILSWLIPIGIFFAIWWFVFRRFAQQQGVGGGMMQIGKSKARVYVEEKTGTTFDQVAGIDESREELEEIVSFLRDPDGYGRLGAKVPKGVLLAGPPGTGKTLIARAVAGEARVPFFFINGSEFVEMFVGVGAARVRDLFEQAKGRAPAIIFIDELDALGAARSAGGGGMAGGSNDEKEQTLNQLLVELDGFDPAEGLVVVGATNRPEVLDPALLRAGRFDRRVLVPRPEKKGRADILHVHLRKVVADPDLDVQKIAQLTAGFTGADLENLVNEAALLATRRGAERVEMSDVTAAIERIVAGPQKKNRILSEDERTRVAYHELGHAVVTMALPGTDPVQKVSIVPRSVGALGYTLQRPTGDRYLMTREELSNKMCVLLAGRAAERVFFDDVSTGAADDLQKVTEIARSLVAQYGMTEELGLLAYEGGNRSQGGLPPALQGRDYADDTARMIDATARELVDDAYERALSVVRRERKRIDEVARTLLEEETLGEARLRELFEGVAEPARPAAAVAGEG